MRTKTSEQPTTFLPLRKVHQLKRMFLTRLPGPVIYVCLRATPPVGNAAGALRHYEIRSTEVVKEAGAMLQEWADMRQFAATTEERRLSCSFHRILIFLPVSGVQCGYLG